ncbi:hypothetical protein N8371_03450 [Vicingaceae bacterium]|nr:hypothetical protein [Vicingaceae bacterium]MDC1451452.1 hypothetical protein [Vicingaceae bacterium]
MTNNTIQFAQKKSPKPPALNKKSGKRESPMVVEPLEQEFAAKQPIEKLDNKEQENAPIKVITTDNVVENTLANVEPMQTKQ